MELLIASKTNQQFVVFVEHNVYVVAKLLLIFGLFWIFYMGFNISRGFIFAGLEFRDFLTIAKNAKLRTS